jgi:hypothetical protein
MYLPDSSTSELKPLPKDLRRLITPITWGIRVNPVILDISLIMSKEPYPKEIRIAVWFSIPEPAKLVEIEDFLSLIISPLHEPKAGLRRYPI